MTFSMLICDFCRVYRNDQVPLGQEPSITVIDTTRLITMATNELLLSPFIYRMRTVAVARGANQV